MFIVIGTFLSIAAIVLFTKKEEGLRNLGILLLCLGFVSFCIPFIFSKNTTSTDNVTTNSNTITEEQNVNTQNTNTIPVETNPTISSPAPQVQSSPTYDDPKVKSGLHLEDKWDSRDDYFNYVEGRITNVSGRYLNYAEVHIVLYNEDLEVIGNTMDNINGLGEGEVWRFKAIADIPPGESYKYKISNLISY